MCQCGHHEQNPMHRNSGILSQSHQHMWNNNAGNANMCSFVGKMICKRHKDTDDEKRRKTVFSTKDKKGGKLRSAIFHENLKNLKIGIFAEKPETSQIAKKRQIHQNPQNGGNWENVGNRQNSGKWQKWGIRQNRGNGEFCKMGKNGQNRGK